MQWIDRQGSVNIKDQRAKLSAGSVGELMIQLEALDDTLTFLENTAAGIPPGPRRRPVGKPDDWAGQARMSAQQYSDEVKSPPLPRPRPDRQQRRYNRGQD